MKFLKIFFTFLFIFLILFTLSLLEDFLFIQNLKNQNLNFGNIDCIIVLTGGKGRISEAFKYINQPNVQFIVISGANPLSSRKDILSHYKEHKHYFKKIIIENFSKNTIENAIETKRIIKGKNVKNILIITSVTHLKRAKYIFKKLFYNVNKKLFFHYSKEDVSLVKLIKERLKFMFDFLKLMFY